MDYAGVNAQASGGIESVDQPSERMALVELVLKYSPRIIDLEPLTNYFANLFWDWSRIQHLALSGVTTIPFIKAMSR